MRIALINEGTHPYGAGPLGPWCDQLVRGLDEHAFWLVDLVEGGPAAGFPVPANVAGLRTVARGGRAVGPDRPVELRQHGRLATHAAVLLCRGMLDDGPHSAAMFRSGMRRLGIPYVLTEHDGYLDDLLLRAAAGRPAVEAVLLRFLRAVARLGYAEAAAIAPPDERMYDWAVRHDADPGRLTLVPPGVDPNDHPPLREEPADPVLAWLGRPAELPLAVQAFNLIRSSVPHAR